MAENPRSAATKVFGRLAIARTGPDHDNVACQRVMTATAVGMRLVALDARLKYYKVTWADEQAD
ncbi:hypothetical protein [Streptomyces sannanensis]|uniref:hypothetical protein n=1 Tax=Streptomyces sannanensis TaxID=285536 RepID=UPI0031E752D2